LFRTFKSRTAFAAVLFVMAAGVAVAAGVSGADAAKAREDHMKALGGAAKALGDQLRSGAPDPAVVKVQAAKIAALANEMPTWFPRGSGPESGARTRALPAIWTDAAGFSAVQHGFAAEAVKLNAAAAAGDMAGVGAQMRNVGGACKTCHDKFRGPELPPA
jgi:cytochrome c556